MQVQICNLTLYLGDYEIEGASNSSGVLTTTNLQRINISVAKGQSISIETNPATGITHPIYHHTDHLTGSSVDTDENGYMLEVQDYMPFGSNRVDQKFQSYANKKKFTGKELDTESGLYYYGARYYQAEIGRFTAMDPLSLNIKSEMLNDPQLLNGYAYARNNPLKLMDENGLYPVRAEATTINRDSFSVRLASFFTSRYNASNSEILKAEAKLHGGEYASKTSGQSNERYVYTQAAGWLDLSHFFAAANQAYNNGYDTAIENGKSLENVQGWYYKIFGQQGAPGIGPSFGASAYSFEDLTSNTIGAYFGAYYLKEAEKNNISFSDALIKYFGVLGISSAADALKNHSTIYVEGYGSWLLPEGYTQEWDHPKLHDSSINKDDINNLFKQ